jgi:hypothetical protein
MCSFLSGSPAGAGPLARFSRDRFAIFQEYMEQTFVHNEWSRLEAVILGIAPELCIPDLEAVHPWWQRASVAMLHTLAKGRRWFQHG